MAPPRRVLNQQLEILVGFLEKNQDMWKGLPPGPPATQQPTRQKWITLAKKLNAVESGALKTPERWKKYWFEWRYKCRKKASNSRRFQHTTDGGTGRFLPIDELEYRVLELWNSTAGTTTAPESSSKESDFQPEDSDSEPLENIKIYSAPVPDKPRQSVASNCSRVTTDEESRSVTPPPKWALEFEKRRIAAEERMASALESIASVMRSQEERRAILDERIADAVIAMAGTVQDLNSGIHDALQHLRHLHPMQNGMDPKDNIDY